MLKKYVCMEDHVLERTKEKRGRRKRTVYTCRECKVSYIKSELPLRDKNGSIINLVDWEKRKLEYPVLETAEKYIELKEKLRISIKYRIFSEKNACMKCNTQMDRVWIFKDKNKVSGKYCPNCELYYFDKEDYRYNMDIFCLSDEEQIIWNQMFQLERQLSNYIQQHYDYSMEEAFLFGDFSEKKSIRKTKYEMDEFLDENFVDAGCANKLSQYMNEKGITTAMIYERCYVDRRLISKFLNSPNYHPSKNTMLALCIGLQLTLEEGEEFLLLAGYSFSNTSKYDLIFKFMLQNEIYDLDFVNDRLHDYGFPCLGE